MRFPLTLQNAAWSFAGALYLLTFTGITYASSLEIRFTGLGMSYAGFEVGRDGSVIGNLADAHDVNGAQGRPAQSDKLRLVEFFVDGALVGTADASIFGDTFIQDVANIPVGGGTVMSQGNISEGSEGFGFDILTRSETSGAWGVGLNISTFDIKYDPGTDSLSGSGMASSLVSQDLPFGLSFDPARPINIAFESYVFGDVTDNGEFLTAFALNSGGSIIGTLERTAVPLPASAWLFFSGFAALAGVSRRQRASARSA